MEGLFFQTRTHRIEIHTNTFTRLYEPRLITSCWLCSPCRPCWPCRAAQRFPFQSLLKARRYEKYPQSRWFYGNTDSPSRSTRWNSLLGYSSLGLQLPVKACCCCTGSKKQSLAGKSSIGTSTEIWTAIPHTIGTSSHSKPPRTPFWESRYW